MPKKNPGAFVHGKMETILLKSSALSCSFSVITHLRSLIIFPHVQVIRFLTELWTEGKP